jgi:DNA repair protein RadA/Sms
MYLARHLQMSVLVVGHMTKDGHIAGPKVLEHLVDVVLTFEGDRHHALRGLRGIKNRFGTTLDIGLFEMTQKGLLEVQDAASFIDVQSPTRIGTVVCPSMHGSRCLLVEIQSLVTSGVFGQARRRGTGLDGSRITRIAAVLEQHAHLKLADQDIYAHAVGGLKLDEPATDVPICLAMLSAYHDLVMPQRTCAFGEVGLGGEIRAVPHIEQRVTQARKHGYTQIIIPITQLSKVKGGALGVSTIEDLRPILVKNPITVTSVNRLSDEEKGGFSKCG